MVQTRSPCFWEGWGCSFIVFFSKIKQNGWNDTLLAVWGPRWILHTCHVRSKATSVNQEREKVFRPAQSQKVNKSQPRIELVGPLSPGTNSLPIPIPMHYQTRLSDATTNTRDWSYFHLQSPSFPPVGRLHVRKKKETRWKGRSDMMHVLGNPICR